MRILKKKIELAKQLRLAKQHLTTKLAESLPEPAFEPSARTLRSNNKVQASTNNITSPVRGLTSCKNIMKNYSRAMVNFAISDLALPYLADSFVKHGLEKDDFNRVLNSQKASIHCIKSMRALLLVQSHDTKETVAFKTIFQEICEVFLKHFSVNWIFNSKISDKIVHLKYRFKILRRVQNPEQFTYLESFSKKGKMSPSQRNSF
jgi:hypothetical protein